MVLAIVAAGSSEWGKIKLKAGWTGVGRRAINIMSFVIFVVPDG